jgi:hypothetical protein
VAEILDRMVLSISSLPRSQPQSRAQLIENRCWKRIYKRDDYRIVIYLTPGASPEELGASAGVERHYDLEPKACLERALVQLHDMGFADAAVMAERYRRQFSELWLDPDVGPVKWLGCARTPEPASQLATFLHEMSHLLQHQSCSYTGEPEYRCFALDESLPHRAVAAISDLHSSQKAEQEGYQLVQEIYLTRLNQPAATLFDELNAYTITTRVMTAALIRYGVNGIVDDASRSIDFLPLFLVYTLRYLEVVRSANFDQYQRNFGRSTLNWQNLEALLVAGQNAYQAYQLALKNHGLHEMELEQRLWSDYRILHARLYLLN